MSDGTESSNFIAWSGHDGDYDITIGEDHQTDHGHLEMFLCLSQFFYGMFQVRYVVAHKILASESGSARPSDRLGFAECPATDYPMLPQALGLAQRSLEECRFPFLPPP
jgi:hypothetical protein